MSIEKSPNDSRDYHYFELPNKMKCLVISDPDTDMAAASVDVNVGSQSDPKSTQGLAHFLEHMLFLGTEKYPVENYYSSFLSENAGSDNAYTGTEDTNFHFKVSVDKLEQALEIFAQFFIGPLFTKDAVDRELKAVDSEHSKNLKNDMWRLWQLSRNFALEWHSFNHFATGNMETLNKPDIYDQVREFYNTKYSSNIMGIVLYGKENIQTLENWVRQSFTAVVDKNLVPEVDMRMPYDETVSGILVKVVPVQDVKHIRFFWSWPPTIIHYKSKPGNYIAHLIGHEGKNSLLSFLKAEGLAQELSASGTGQQYSNLSILVVNVELTDKGLENYERVIEITHAYIAMLKEKGVQEWIYEEIKALAQADFNFKSKSDPLSYCEYLSWRLHRYPHEKIISGSDLIEEFNPDLLRSFIDLLTPQNLQVYLISKKFDESQMQTERWYGTKYSVEKFSSDLQTKMTNFQVSHPKFVLDLPVRNDFIPTVFDVLPLSDKPLPLRILDNEKNTVWHKQDDTFKVDKVCSQLMIYCNDAGFQDSPYFYLLAKIWRKIFWDKFREENYLAEQGGLKLSLHLEHYGLKLSLSGYSQKYDKFFETVLERLATVVIDNDDKELFQSHWTHINDSLNNHFLSAPTNQAMKLCIDLMLLKGHFSELDQLKALQNVTFEDLLWFHSKWLKTVRFEWFVMGNFSQERTISMVESCTRVFEQAKNCCYIRKDDYPRLQVIEIPKTPFETSVSSLVYPVYLLDQTNNNSISVSLWQLDAETLKSQAILSVLDTFIKEPCYDTLRTKEQLGYIVSSFIRKLRGVLHFNIIVQSSVAAPFFLTNRISNFINEIRKELKEISDEKFNTNRESTIKSLTKKDMSIFEQYRRFILEVDSGAYLFGRREDIEAELRKVTKEEFQRCFEELFFDGARRLDVEVICEGMRESQESVTKNREVIKTPSQFKRRVRSLPQVYIRD
ncbi:unnamed protein product [Blepharisma stoltei]|uniref:Insulin-degrading enzyme n=1 Tax=Blepharisma stoltei TaxID=1481888 RepID=A0AAU9IXB0_9CILI|nr:unnamed protein product [Blepharisma stoltei]